MLQLTDTGISDPHVLDVLSRVTPDVIDEFAAYIAGMSDSQLREQWHIGDGPDGDRLVELARELQSGSGR